MATDKLNPGYLGRLPLDCLLLLQSYLNYDYGLEANPVSYRLVVPRTKSILELFAEPDGLTALPPQTLAERRIAELNEQAKARKIHKGSGPRNGKAAN